MKTSKSQFVLSLALACAAITFSLAVRAQAQTLTYIGEFNGTNGKYPGPLVQGTDGNFYGIASLSTGGQMFRVTPAGVISTLYTFCSQSDCAEGNTPQTPILGNDGNFYGAMWGGGDITNSGTVYKLTLAGALTVLHTFNCASLTCSEGATPGAIVQGSNGNFYGVASNRGAGGGGTFFQINPTSGEFDVLYAFCSLKNCTDGSYPYGAPIQGRDGNFYGATIDGGTQGGGVLYELTLGGKYSVLYNFCYDGTNCRNNAYPTGLVQDDLGNFFGTTAWAGSYNSGSVFELSPSHRLSILHQFVYGGQEDAGSKLLLASDGNFYGVAGDNDFDYNSGICSIYEISPQGAFSNLYTAYDGLSGPLFQGTDGNLYGTAGLGIGGYGSVFKLSTGLAPLVETAPTSGRVNSVITIIGNGLTGTSSVKFNGVAASFTVESDTFIKVGVPAGATTGTVSVVTPGGALNSYPQFVVTK